MSTAAMILALIANASAVLAWCGLVWLARKTDLIAQRLGPDRLTADNAADVVHSLAGDPVTASSSERTVTGLIVPYGVAGDTSAGSYAVDAGAFTLPTDLSRVKLLRGHDRERPVGYLAATREDSAGLWGTFAIAPGADGDEAIAEVRARTRDGLSYEVSRVRYSGDRTRVVAARLDAVALCSVPAYDDARAIAASRQENTGMLTLETARAILADANATAHDRAAAIAFLASNPDASDADRATAAAAAGNSADAPDAGNGGTGGAPADTGSDAPNLAAVTAGRAPGGIELRGNRSPAAMTAEQRIERGIETLAQTIRGAADAGAVNAALADVVPADDTGAGILRPQWLGELWRARRVQRDFINSTSRGKLTGLKVYGWQWQLTPEVDDYAGNKTEVPTNPVKTVPIEDTAKRKAGGWDVDRVFFDLGDAGFLSSFLAMATDDYGIKTEAGYVADLLAGATVPPDTITGLLDGIDVIARALSQVGANVSFIGMSADLWSEYIAIPASDAPWWLAKQSSVNIADVSTDIDGLHVFASHNLPANTMLAGDRRAATYYEASPSPIRVQAVNIPQGGIDLGVFGYDASLINDPRALVKVTVPATPPAGL